MSAANLPALVQRFFTDRLQSQLGASPHTIASYRDTFRLLLAFASGRTRASHATRSSSRGSSFPFTGVGGRQLNRQAGSARRSRVVAEMTGEGRGRCQF
jgi:hypothetical protein